MRREKQVGRHQFRVLQVLVALDTRPVDGRWLAYVANDGGDQTQGSRVLTALEVRGFIARPEVDRLGSRVDASKWRITNDGTVAWAEALPAFVDAILSR